MTPDADALVALRDALRRFAEEREWERFHSPKNLATALAVEAAELLEHYQWAEAATDAAKVREEVADVFLYLIRLADTLGIDLAAAAWDKIAINARKYPVAKARGHARKYTEL